MASRRLWILDGHNIIFAHSELAGLQTSRRGAQARSRLVDWLVAFAHEKQEQVLLVFDGNDVPSSPDTEKTGLFEAVYGGAGAGGADRRILLEARRRSSRGFMVTVVTDDVRTLAVYLPPGVRRLSVREFWRLHIEAPEHEEDKRIEADFSAIEKELLALESDPSPSHSGRCLPLRTSTATADISTSAGGAIGPDEVRAKRERGRLRHERMVKRRGRPL